MTPLVITICATRSYTYAMLAQARRVVACLTADPELWTNGLVVLVGDGSAELAAVKKFYGDILPAGWGCTLITREEKDGLENYKSAAQCLIARLRSIAFDEARRVRAEFCWSLDSDVLPSVDSLLCMAEMLRAWRGYYSVATCPYPSQGGGDFLGGRGTEQQAILPDVYDDERVLTPELLTRIEQHKAAAEEGRKASEHPPPEWTEEGKAIREAVKQCPPSGNVFALNAKRFRRRGWLSSAYPGIGRGSVVPTDWTGMGCTLMGPHALALVQWDGYAGEGTEDLYINWRRWNKAGLRMCVIPHAPCDHVIRNPDKEKGGYVLMQAHHETLDVECEGHLRVEARPWLQHTRDEGWSSN